MLTGVVGQRYRTTKGVARSRLACRRIGALLCAQPVLCLAGMITLLIATRNAHKVQEIRAILGEKFHYLTLDDVPNPPEVIEDAGTFAGNASKKAVALANCLGEAQALKRRLDRKST